VGRFSREERARHRNLSLGNTGAASWFQDNVGD
jgi:hypothetical protein